MRWQIPRKIEKRSDIPCGGYDCSPGVSAIHDSRSQFPGLSFGTGVYRRDRRNGSRVVVTPAGRAATKIDCSRRGIASLAGIEYFPLLEELNCCMNMISTLDLTQNPRLVKLDCSGNCLKSLDVSHNSVLMELRCMLNELVALETDRNPKLTVLHCAFNRSLKALDVTGNPLLKELVCTENSLSSLDVSHNLELKNLCAEMVLSKEPFGNPGC